MAHAPLISVILATHNRRESLKRTLQSLFAQDFAAQDYEVVVAADGCSDGTNEYLRGSQPRCGWKALVLPHGERAVARNAAIAVAEGELLVFLDDDIICPPDLLRKHWEAHRAADDLVCIGKVTTESPPGDELPSVATEWTVRVDADAMAELDRSGQLVWPRDFSIDANSSARRAHVTACGGFDAAFYRTRENADLGLRLWKRGLRFQYLPAAFARQAYVKTDDQVMRVDARWNGENEVRLARKHPEYRPHCWVSRLQEGGARKRRLRQALVRLPFSVEPLLRLVFRLCAALRRSLFFRRLAIRLLQVRSGVVMFRAACRAAGGWEELQAEFGEKLAVLLYHRVGAPRAGTMASLTVAPRKFARDMRALKRWGYTAISAEDWQAWVREAKPLPLKPVLITFDDAYDDLREHAFPMLEQLGLKATVFVVTGELGGRNAWDTARGHEELPLLAADALREWARRGIEFAAHSHTHADLRSLSPAEVAREAAMSKASLDDVMGKAPTSFAYPYGDMNTEVRAAVALEFPVAFTADPGLNILRTDLLALHRTMVLPTDTLLDLWLRLRLGDSPFNNLRARVRLRTRLKRLFAAEPA